jgi:hypothetical protein
VRALLTLAVLVLVIAPHPVGAAALELNDRLKQEAIRVGRKSVTTETFEAEWRLSNTSGESVTVFTPFHRVALAARHAAFKNEPLKPTEPDKILKEQGDRLLLWTYLKGTREDFARYYIPRLLVGDLEIEASFVQNERTAVRDDAGYYVARCVYGFPTKGITGSSRVVLAVRNPDGDDVSRFTIDLSTMR